jgi:ParB/RepB/Spo0J family partition protein
VSIAEAEVAPASARNLLDVPLTLIDVTGKNLGREADIDELVGSIGTVGLLTPIVVRPAGDRYLVAAGHRRLAAVRRLGWTTIPAFVRELSESEFWQTWLVENLHRKPLLPSEEARAFAQLRAEGLTLAQVSAVAHRSVAHICQRLKMLDWDPTLVARVDRHEISFVSAQRLAAGGKEGNRFPNRWAAKSEDGIRPINVHLLEELSRFLSLVANDENPIAPLEVRSKARALGRNVSQLLQPSVAVRTKGDA